MLIEVWRNYKHPQNYKSGQAGLPAHRSCGRGSITLDEIHLKKVYLFGLVVSTALCEHNHLPENLPRLLSSFLSAKFWRMLLENKNTRSEPGRTEVFAVFIPVGSQTIGILIMPHLLLAIWKLQWCCRTD
jgi:hypothetical protein